MKHCLGCNSTLSDDAVTKFGAGYVCVPCRKAMKALGNPNISVIAVVADLVESGDMTLEHAGRFLTETARLDEDPKHPEVTR